MCSKFPKMWERDYVYKLNKFRYHTCTVSTSLYHTILSFFFHLNVNRSYVPSFKSYSKVCRMKRMMSLALTTEKEREGAKNLEIHFGPTTALIVKLLFLFCDCLAYFYCFTPYPFLSFFQEVLNSW